MTTWNAKCPIFKARVAGFRDKVASKNRTLGVPGTLVYRDSKYAHKDPVMNQSRISWNVREKVCVAVAPNGVFLCVDVGHRLDDV